jgi:ubiquinone/menaquinone biosynthesis C-methylase UbiE
MIMRNGDTLQSEVWTGKKKEHRKSNRRKTFAPVTFIGEGESTKKISPLNGNDQPCALDLSLDGAFIKNRIIPHLGDHINLKIDLPMKKSKPLTFGGRVIRAEKNGFGVEFSDLHYQDRSLLRNYIGFSELDDTVVSIQNKLKGVLNGNLLPALEPEKIHERLLAAHEKKIECLVLFSKTDKPCTARIELDQDGLVLRDLSKKIDPQTRIVYVIILDGPLHAVFEGLIHQQGQSPKIVYPERIYLNDRRWSRRISAEKEWMYLSAPHLKDSRLVFPLLDKSESGCSVKVPKQFLFTFGMRLPAFELKTETGHKNYGGATISRILDFDDRNWLMGLQFFDNSQSRDVFNEINQKCLHSNYFDSIRRFSSMVFQKLKTKVVNAKSISTSNDRERPYVVEYKNARGEKVVALLNATFDLNSDAPPVDAAVVICPPFPVRKEVFGLLARTLVDNFRNQGKHAVVLRFDMTHCLGESQVDPEMKAKGHPYLEWKYSYLIADISGSLSFLEKRFIPEKRVLISYSASAIACRFIIANDLTPQVDHWISPFGCPDVHDLLMNLLAGVDLFEPYIKGETLTPFLIYGRLFDPNVSVADAVKYKLAFLEDARNDMEKIKIPATWIIGTYDYMVTRSRVKEMFNAPGGGTREIIEVGTGHNPRTGAEAIESFKIVYESISKHLFNLSNKAVEPDLVRYSRQTELEWARTRKKKIHNMEKFWEAHLFGTSTEKEGYDVILYNPDYVEFIDKQVELLDVAPNMRLADFGCGTGNLFASLLKQLDFPDASFQLSCYDLVPAAVKTTRKKLEKLIEKFSGKKFKAIQLDCSILDLETARLSGLKEFLEGNLFSIQALKGRIEGLNAATLRKLDQVYNQEIHDIILGKLVSVESFQKTCPHLEKGEIQEILDLSMASRFLKDKTLPEDWRNQEKPVTAMDLALNVLTFGNSGRQSKIECPSNCFDRIGASLVIPYVFDPESVLKEFYRILDNRGVIVLSSLKPNADSSKFYSDEAIAIANRTDLDEKEKHRLLESLREFSAFLSRLIELEDEGRFHFFPINELVDLVEKAGFSHIQCVESLGNPPIAVIIRAEKKSR